MMGALTIIEALDDATVRRCVARPSCSVAPSKKSRLRRQKFSCFFWAAIMSKMRLLLESLTLDKPSRL